MNARTDVEYSYEPTGFFEAETVVVCSLGTLRMTPGKAVMTLIQPRTIDRAAAAEVTALVKDVFHARQVLVHSRFRLTHPNVVHYRPDGGRDAVMLAEPDEYKWGAFSADILIADTAGNVVRDTKADRIAEHTAFLIEMASKVSASPTLRRMLASYSAAVSDPGNELVHLYEIRDAVRAHYGGKTKALRALAISEADWQRIGRLANHEPLKEGRHRGEQTQPLRPATDDELEEVRATARRFIERFAAAV